MSFLIEGGELKGSRRPLPLAGWTVGGRRVSLPRAYKSSVSPERVPDQEGSGTGGRLVRASVRPLYPEALAGNLRAAAARASFPPTSGKAA